MARHSIANFIATVCCLNVAGAILWALQDVPPGTAQLLRPAEEQRIIESLPRVPPGLNGAYALNTRPSRTISAAYTYTVKAPHLTAREWIMIVPKPPDLPAQAIRNARTSPEGNVIQDLSPRHQPLLRARIQAGNESLQHEISFQLLFDADLFSRRLVEAGNRDPAARPAASLPEDERRLSLRPTRQIDYADKAIENWAAKVGLKDRAAEEGEVDYAYRVFQAIVSTCQYEYRNEQDRAASHVATVGRSDCGGLCNLFAALLRVHGIPARTLAGRWAFSARPGQRMGEVEYFQEHIKAELFAQGVGWVPIDLSSAVLYGGPSERSRYFGNDPGNFVTIHLDGELTSDTIYFGNKTINLLQKASYWVTGLGSLAGVVISENWLIL